MDLTNIIESAKTTNTLIIIALVIIVIIVFILITKHKPKKVKSIPKKEQQETIIDKDSITIETEEDDGEVIPALIDYIGKAKDHDLSDNEIKQNLLDARWPEQDIDKTLAAVNDL